MVIGMIPARYNSSRLSRKLAIKVKGRPILWYAYNTLSQCNNLDQILIVTDSIEIAKICKQFHMPYLVTSGNHLSGSSRLCEAVNDLDFTDSDIVVNFQGDVLNFCAGHLKWAIRHTQRSKETSTFYYNVRNKKKFHRPNYVKVATDIDDAALMFSRLPIPYKSPYLKIHVGIYVYTVKTLNKYFAYPNILSQLKYENLEQLSMIESGHNVQCFDTRPCINLDTKADLIEFKRSILYY